ncbi:MAG: hypothetical protein WKF89_14995, partial [Chitinophagaceae bacterium]
KRFCSSVSLVLSTSILREGPLHAKKSKKAVNVKKLYFFRKAVFNSIVFSYYKRLREARVRNKKCTPFRPYKDVVNRGRVAAPVWKKVAVLYKIRRKYVKRAKSKGHIKRYLVKVVNKG